MPKRRILSYSSFFEIGTNGKITKGFRLYNLGNWNENIAIAWFYGFGWRQIPTECHACGFEMVDSSLFRIVFQILAVLGRCFLCLVAFMSQNQDRDCARFLIGNKIGKLFSLEPFKIKGLVGA